MEKNSLAMFEVLCRQNYDKVYRTVFYYTKDNFITEEAVQQAFVISFRKIDTLLDKEKFASWVITIALNEAKHLLKKRQLEKTVILFKGIPNIPKGDSSLSSLETKMDVNNILKRLKPQEAEVLILKYYADLTMEQIASSTNLSLSNVKVRLHRAKESFRRAMKDVSNQDLGGEL